MSKTDTEELGRGGMLSIKVSEEVARAFRAEAAKRGLFINALFLELWSKYKENMDVT